MQFRSLESRIATLFLVLILLVQLVGFFAIRTAIYANATESVNDELVLAERVFNRLLEQNAQKLAQSARLLAADTGFKSAIADNDKGTIESALDNQRSRVDASLALLVSADRSVKAATTRDVTPALQALVLQMVALAEQGGNPVRNTLVGNVPSQIVVVPVRAPITIGWVVMAFPINQKLASDAQLLSSSYVTVVTQGLQSQLQAVVSTFSPAEADSVVNQLRTIPTSAIKRGGAAAVFDVQLGATKYRARMLDIARGSSDANGADAAPGSEQTASVVLLRSVSEAVAPYDQLQLWLLLLTLLGIALAFAGSIFTAKRIAQPLQQLAANAKLLGAGNYTTRLEIKREDEIGQLAKAFDSMQGDIAARELEIRRLAYWDALTNLPNRAQFVMWLQEALINAKAQNREQDASKGCYVLMLDLDRFKHVNDVMGHAFGDALLCQVGVRLQSVLDADGAVGGARLSRLGGDEFAVLLTHSTLAQAQQVASAILQSLEAPLSLDDQTVDLGAGLGIAGYPEHGADAETLMRLAEVAMYTAKLRRDGAVVYDPALDKASKLSLSLLSELRSAIDGNQFRLFVQPKMQLSTGAVVGIESLVRWVHPTKGMVFPDNFIPFAEQTGFIRVLTRWVLDQSAALSRQLADSGVHLKVSVNLSTRDLLDQDLPAKFADILARHKVTCAAFCLEITESAIMDDPVRAQQTLEKLHAMGVDLSIDDFGTGYSSLAYLKQLPVNELKIDKSFVLNMAKDANDTKIVRSTIDLGHNMGLRVVAEGVETEAVWHLLAKLGCDQGQGYFMSKPMPADKLADWLKSWVPPVAQVDG
jgi:diguanylate cyclase